MTKSTPSNGKPRRLVASVPPPTGLTDELLGQLVAFRPIEVKTLETARGMVEATICQVVSIDENEEVHDRGELPVYWEYVREQLRQVTPEIPWVSGVLTKPARAYRLRELDEDQTERIVAAVHELSE
ncbi:MAG: hypothetical protein QOI06_1790 [Nocardioidaceae bacterium]|jgi:hypothetical protein|nr:hypothetical protein [Nocardioidaceae bacterium]